MGATIIDSRIFGNIFSTDAMRHVWSDEHRTAKYVEIERALAVVQGRLGIIPQEAADEIVRNCDPAKFDLDRLRARHRADRLSDPRRGVAAERAVPRQAGRVLPLGRDHAGRHGHRDGPADPRRAGARRGRPRRDLGRARGARAQVPRHARRRPQQPAAGDSGDVRLQGGDDPRGGRAAPRAAGAVEAARAGRRVRRRVRHARVDRARRDGDAGGPDGRARARAAGDRLAHRARQHRRGRRVPGARRRHARARSRWTSSS